MSLDRYDAPTGAYTSLIPPGIKAVREVIAEEFGYTRTEVVRDHSRCRSRKSEHCECGAIDFFTTDLVKGRKLFDWLVRHADKLGVQSVIFNRRVIGFGNPNERHYTPSGNATIEHRDHVHVGFSRWARKNLTKQMVRACLGQEAGVSKQDVIEALNQLKPEDLDADSAFYKIWAALYEKRGQLFIEATDEARDVLKADIAAAKKEILDAINAP